MKQITIVGNVGQDPKIENDQKTGKKKCQISVGVNNGKNDDGSYKPSDWFYATFWEKQAETLAQYVKKGHKIAVSGEFQLSTWQRQQDGTTQHSLYINNPKFDLIGETVKNGTSPAPAPATAAAPLQPAPGDPF